MDWKSLFFSAEGRIGRQSFWIGWLVLLGVNVVLGWIPFIGQLLSLVTIYCFVCIYSKRLHDMGKSGWLQAIPLVICFVLPIIGMFAFGGAALVAGLSGASEAAATTAVLGSLGGFFVLLFIAMIVGIGFLLWVGISDGETGDNRFGPPPSAIALA